MFSFMMKRLEGADLLKLSLPWIGPYEVTEVDDVNITLKLQQQKNA